MVESLPGLLLIGFAAGLIAGVSPCVLPVLPVVFAGWTTEVVDRRRNTRRAVAVVAGLVASFSILTLAGTVILDALGLPDELLRDLGLVMIGLIGVALIVPGLERYLEAPFRRLGARAPAGVTSGLVLGLALGAVFVPCAGPVLATISVLGATHHVGVTTVALTACFSLGAALPLLFVALAGERLVERNQRLRERARRLRPFGGALLIVMALGLGLNWFAGVQRWLPSYTASLQRGVESNSFAQRQLAALRHAQSTGGTSCVAGSPTLANCGAAANFTGVTAWLNTPAGRALSLRSLRGRVVLVDFWTYSCINCQRSLPHVEAWYARYRKLGLTVVGVHSPEFAFEHDVANVRSAASSLGVRYPVAVDDQLATWNAYANSYWPAEYLIDATGQLRHVDYGEGLYPETESLIRQLLRAAHPGVALPAATEVADVTPLTATSYETYLGYERLQYLAGAQPVDDQMATYQLPSTIPSGSFGLAGRWRIGPERATSGADARLDLHFVGHDVYLVLGGAGTLSVTVNGKHSTIAVSGVPRLYTLLAGTALESTTMHLGFTPGIAAYDFTFG